jgi:hypothetical protein
MEPIVAQHSWRVAPLAVAAAATASAVERGDESRYLGSRPSPGDARSTGDDMRMIDVATGVLMAMAMLASGCGGDAADEGQGFAPQAPAVEVPATTRKASGDA